MSNFEQPPFSPNVGSDRIRPRISSSSSNVQPHSNLNPHVWSDSVGSGTIEVPACSQLAPLHPPFSSKKPARIKDPTPVASTNKLLSLCTLRSLRLLIFRFLCFNQP